MNGLQRLIASATVLVLAMNASDLFAQQKAGNFFNEQFVNVFDPESRTYFSLQTMQGNQFGGQQPFTSIGATNFQGSIDSAVTLFTGNFLVNNNGNPAGTFGMQYRRLAELGWLKTSIVGAGIYLDLNQSVNNNLFEQVDLNFEIMTESAWVARLNGYLPVGEIQQQTGIQTQSGGSNGQLSLVGTQVYAGGISRQLMDVALMGSDAEFGRKFFGYRAEVYGGYYTWNGPLVGFTTGVKGGVRGYITDNLSGNVAVSHDSFFGTNVYGGLTYVFGGRGGSRPLSFLNLMTTPAQRAQQVAIANGWRTTGSFHAAEDALTGDKLNVYFVEQGGAGTGVQANASSVTSVLGNSGFGHGSAMVLLGGGGPITSPIVLTQDRQQIVGGGTTGVANIDFSRALSEAAGTSVLHLSGLGAPAVLAPTSGNAITLTNQNIIQGFTIDGVGGLTNGIVGAPGANGTLIQNMTIQNVAGTGVLIQPSTNTTIDHVAFSNNGQDVVLDAQNSTITNVTSTGSVNGSISLGAGGNITGTTLIQNVGITNAGGFGGIQLNNAQSGATVNVTNVSVNGGAGSGVTISNAQSGSIFNLTHVGIGNVGGDGLSLQTSGGTVNFDRTSQITSPLGVPLLVNGGTINVNFDGGITQANNSAAVSIMGGHTGTIAFSTLSTVFATNGTGFQFDEAKGTYNFLGTNNLNAANADIFIQDSNGTFRFDNTTINTASAGVKIVGDASNKPQSTFNNLSITTNSNPGFLVTNAGTTTISGSTFNVVAGDGLLVNNTAFTVNNTAVNQTFGYTISSTDSILNGTGNTAASFSGNDGGGNTGTISFNGGANVFP